MPRRKTTHCYHLIIDGTRTSVTMDILLSNLLAVKLDTNPFADGRAAHKAVRGWLQAEVNRDPGAFVSRTARRKGVTNHNSQRLKMFALRAVAAPALLRKLDDYEETAG